MDLGDNRPRPVRGPSASAHSSERRFSSVSDVSDYDSAYDSVTSLPLRGRESLVSLPSHDDLKNASPNTHDRRDSSGGPGGWAYPFTAYPGASGGYQPVSVTGVSPSRRPSLLARAARSMRQTPEDTIPEEHEGIDMALLPSAAPLGQDQETGSPVEELNEPAFDLTSMLGPSTEADKAFVKSLQEQEAAGKLTGGIGAGWQPAKQKVKESELLAASPTIERSLSRSFTRRTSLLGRRATVKALGQSEANKRGEVIEVIMEEEPEEEAASNFDLSNVTGPDTGAQHPSVMHGSTFPTKREKTVVFYPQANWKPFSMRRPYLLGLILLSVGLTVLQEVMYRNSTRHPLVEFHSPSDIPPVAYFAFKFLPTVIAVTYGVLWQITDFNVKRLEAYYQLSKEGGALAAESINVDYITNFSFFRPFTAIYLRNYAVAVSSIASLLAVSLVPTLGTAAIMLTPGHDARLADPTGLKHITISSLWSRMLTSILAICAFLGCILFYQLQSRRSGLVSDVKGIAGLASMAVVSHILMDFKDMDVATHEDIHRRLDNRRYVLRNGALAPDDDTPVSERDQKRYRKNGLPENPHPLMLRPTGCLSYIGGVVLFSVLIPVVLFTPATVITDSAPGVITFLAVCLKLGWTALETSVRMMEPFYILSQRHAPAPTLALDYTAMPFGWVAIRALLNRHLLVFLVCFGTVMTEILTVLVTSLTAVEGRDFISLAAHGNTAPSSGGGSAGQNPQQEVQAGPETPTSFWVSMCLTIFILVYMGAVALTVFLRRRHPFLPRQPNTIASILAFIHQSKMLYDFVGVASPGGAGEGRGERVEEMEQRLEASVGKSYGLGWFQGRDGQTHCGIDQEELISNYRHGIDYSRSNKPWVDDHIEWL